MPTRLALREEIDVGVGERDAAEVQSQQARVAAPALPLAVEAEMAAERGVVGRRIAALVRGEDAPVGGLGEARLAERRLGVGDRGIVDRDEAMEAARRGGPLIR